MPTFAQRLIDWQRRHGRHDLPWQDTRDPYRVWLSEIMLQQTQVATVMPYYARFLQRFPALAYLAAAPVEDVMALWSGLGYYARARNLHHCAQAVMREHDGRFPQQPAELAALPGIGPSTANAIAAFCFGARVPILDGNVKRLLCRCFGIDGYAGHPRVESQLWQLAESLLPRKEVAAYIQAQMDMGATVCTRTRPRCAGCPVAGQCIAHAQSRVAELPAAKPRKAVPTVTLTLLVIRNGKRVLLEQRPDKGIWGGLLSLPELPPDAEAEQFCLEQFGLRIGTVAPAPTFRHLLTHRQLHIQPLVCAAHSTKTPPGMQWAASADWLGAALPAPVRGLLGRLSANP